MYFFRFHQESHEEIDHRATVLGEHPANNTPDIALFSGNDEETPRQKWRLSEVHDDDENKTWDEIHKIVLRKSSGFHYMRQLLSLCFSNFSGIWKCWEMVRILPTCW
jgi:hypothetical protein